MIEEGASKSTPSLPWENGIVFASMGRDNEIKGYWHLIKAFAWARKLVPNSHLMIIGDGDFIECKQLARELNLEQDIYFTGVQKNPYPYLKQASIYVLSSINEGFPNAIIEALALSIPVIATDCLTGPAEILSEKGESMNYGELNCTDYGILVPRVKLNNDYDPKHFEYEDVEMGKAMVLMAKEEKLSNTYVQRARGRAAMFSGERYMRELFGE